MSKKKIFLVVTDNRNYTSKKLMAAKDEYSLKKELIPLFRHVSIKEVEGLYTKDKDFKYPLGCNISW